jgi:hypothetical protein
MQNDLPQELFSRFLRRLDSENQPVSTHLSLCSWSDLLGFGRTFTESAWLPSEEQWRVLASRADKAYRTHLRHLFMGEYVLCLNDGIVRAITMVSIGQTAMWLRHLALAHSELNRTERAMTLPGARTVVAFGVRAEYTFEEVTLDDLTLDHTRPAEGSSRNQHPEGATTVVSNLSPLQLNTAFSIAYLLDTLGSRQGLEGPGFFVDERVFAALRVWSERQALHLGQGLRVVDEDRGSEWFFGVKGTPLGPDGREGLLGFLCASPPISVQDHRLSTTVRKVLRYFPDDEEWNDFSIDLT